MRRRILIAQAGRIDATDHLVARYQQILHRFVPVDKKERASSEISFSRGTKWAHGPLNKTSMYAVRRIHAVRTCLTFPPPADLSASQSHARVTLAVLLTCTLVAGAVGTLKVFCCFFSPLPPCLFLFLRRISPHGKFNKGQGMDEDRANRSLRGGQRWTCIAACKRRAIVSMHLIWRTGRLSTLDQTLIYFRLPR